MILGAISTPRTESQCGGYLCKMMLFFAFNICVAMSQVCLMSQLSRNPATVRYLRMHQCSVNDLLEKDCDILTHVDETSTCRFSDL